MTSPEIVALRCPSCGSGHDQPSREISFGAEFRCDHCGLVCVLIIDRALVPLSSLQQRGDKVCIACGRTALREARFCQDGHLLVRTCVYDHCGREFSVDHQRCDFCGNLQSSSPRLHMCYRGTVTGVESSQVTVNIGVAVGYLLKAEVNPRDLGFPISQLREGHKIKVDVMGIDDDGRVALRIYAPG